MTGKRSSQDVTSNARSNRSSRWWLRHDSECVEIKAPAQTIYQLVANMPRMGDWSPECHQVEWLEGFTGPAKGASFIGHNRGGPGGLMKWSRRGRVLCADPGREFAFVTEEGGRPSTEWRYLFEPVEGGTRVTELYTVRWIPTWARILDVPTNRARELRLAMQQTLGRLKGAAEGTPSDR
jgi:Polyketide cyclase / dehydrase and lipid transport